MDTLTPANNLEKTMVYKATLNRTPISGAFELLPLCNLNCRMCYLRKSAELCKDYSSLLPVDFWLNIAEQLQNQGTLFLQLTGGEPFLYPEFETLYRKLREMGFILTLNTNGTMITMEKAAFLAENQPRRVNITLYGTSAETYKKVTGSASAYERAIEGIGNLLEVGVQVKMNVSLIPDNVDELEEFYRVADHLGIPLEVNSYMFPATREEGEIYEGLRLDPLRAAAAELLDMKLRISDEMLWEKCLDDMKVCYKHRNDVLGNAEKQVLPCRAGRSSFWINWKGELSPCVFLGTGKVCLKEMGFSEGWKRICEVRESIFLPEKCSACLMRRFCPVCGVSAYHDSIDSQNPPEYLCRMTEEKLRLASL